MEVLWTIAAVIVIAPVALVVLFYAGAFLLAIVLGIWRAVFGR